MKPYLFPYSEETSNQFAHRAKARHLDLNSLLKEHFCKAKGGKGIQAASADGDKKKQLPKEK